MLDKIKKYVAQGAIVFLLLYVLNLVMKEGQTIPQVLLWTVVGVFFFIFADVFNERFGKGKDKNKGKTKGPKPKQKKLTRAEKKALKEEEKKANQPKDYGPTGRDNSHPKGEHKKYRAKNKKKK